MNLGFEAVHTERLLLRQFEDRDRQPFYELNADPEVAEYLGGPLSREASDQLAATIAERIAEQGWGLWAVEVKRGGGFAGFVGLNRTRFKMHFTPCLEVGWRLGKRHWGQGYATEAGAAALQYAFTQLDEEQVVSFTAVGNWRSRRVMSRLGMSHDPAGDFDHPKLPPGNPLRRHVLYRLFREGWRQPQGGGVRGEGASLQV